MTIRRVCIFTMSNLEQSPSIQKFDGRFPKVSCKKIVYGYSSELKKNRLTVNHLQVKCFLWRNCMATVRLTPVGISPRLGAASDGSPCPPRYYKNVRFNDLPPSAGPPPSRPLFVPNFPSERLLLSRLGSDARRRERHYSVAWRVWALCM